jgi:hypothetical protein
MSSIPQLPVATQQPVSERSTSHSREAGKETGVSTFGSVLSDALPPEESKSAENAGAPDEGGGDRPQEAAEEVTSEKVIAAAIAPTAVPAQERRVPVMPGVGLSVVPSEASAEPDGEAVAVEDDSQRGAARVELTVKVGAVEGPTGLPEQQLVESQLPVQLEVASGEDDAVSEVEPARRATVPTKELVADVSVERPTDAAIPGVQQAVTPQVDQSARLPAAVATNPMPQESGPQLEKPPVRIDEGGVVFEGPRTTKSDAPDPKVSSPRTVAAEEPMRPIPTDDDEDAAIRVQTRITRSVDKESEDAPKLRFGQRQTTEEMVRQVEGPAARRATLPVGSESPRATEPPPVVASKESAPLREPVSARPGSSPVTDSNSFGGEAAVVATDDLAHGDGTPTDERSEQGFDVPQERQESEQVKVGMSDVTEAGTVLPEDSSTKSRVMTPVASGSAAPVVVTAPAPSGGARPTAGIVPVMAESAVAKSPLAEDPQLTANLQQQASRTTLNVVMHDDRLGRVALQLIERGGWIETAVRASDPRAVQVLSNATSGLLETLQQRGITAIAAGGSAAWDAQEGQRRDNPHRDQDPQRRRLRVHRQGQEFIGALAQAGR